MIIPTPRIYFGRARVEPEAIPEFKHTHEMTGREFRTYITSVVYIWKRGEVYLYIGSSICGLQRIVTTKHHVFRREKVRSTDTILMMFNLTCNQARLLEVELIREHKPKYNKTSQSNGYMLKMHTKQRKRRETDTPP